MKRLLVVVDFQNDFVEGALGFEGAEKLESRIVAKIEEYREAGDEVVFTLDTHHDDYLETEEGKNLPIVHCIEGSAGWQFYGKVASFAVDNEGIFKKPTFGSMDFAEFLARRNRVAQELNKQPFISIELVGLVSNICVLSNAVIAKAACPNVPIIIDATLTDSFDKELQEKAFDVLGGLHIKVINR